MSYYQWVSMEIQIYHPFVNETQLKETKSDTPVIIDLWMNLLYVKQDSVEHYQSYSSVSRDYCDSVDIYCLATFYELQFVGFLCFGIFFFAATLQAYDIAIIFYNVIMKKTSELSF